MIVAKALTGIWSAVLTPLDERLEPDAARAIAYYRGLLDAGCDGINLLGTTGEAMSLGARQRAALMEAVARSGFPMERAMTGTGAASLDDAVHLTRAAFDLDFAAALVMPPFFFREVGDDGVVRFFDALLSRAHTPGKRVLLYNFPRMSGVTFHPDLVDRLLREFPEAIVGMKDSSNDRALQAEVLRRHPQFTVFPGSEDYLVQARAYGAAGCISGSVCLWPKLAKEVLQRADPALAQQLATQRQSLTGAPLIAIVRYLTARARHDEAWERTIPPLVPLNADEREALSSVDVIVEEVRRTPTS